MKKIITILLIILLIAGTVYGLNVQYGFLENKTPEIKTVYVTIPVITPEPEIEPEPDQSEEENSIKYEPVDFDYDSYLGNYIIKVNVECNTVTVYVQDEDGDYLIPVKAMLCSTGSDTMTEGIYVPGEQHKWANLFGDVYGQYSVEIKGDILFHSVPYTTWGNPGTLEYWEYDKLGTSCSKGCVRLCVADAKWIYENTSRITAIIMYEDTVPGPLGKPELEPISENEVNRGWDPTDPDPENLWLGGSGNSVYTMKEHLIEEAKYNG